MNNGDDRDAKYERVSARTPIFYSIVAELPQKEQRDIETYKPPKPMIEFRVTFRNWRICIFQISGIGRQMRAKSVMMCVFEQPTENHVALLRHGPSSQFRLTVEH